jgi:hypothetical protein
MNSKIRPKNVAASFIACVAFAFSPLTLVPVYGQVVGATLSGTVRDQSGGVVPQAAISIKNIATGITRAVTTDPAGFYLAPNLLPGNYEIATAAPGFSSEVQTGIKLTVGEQQVLNFTLQVGQTTQTVAVTTEAPTVELASSSISAVVDSTTVRELPLNGRSWTDLATLQPGVAAIQTQPGIGPGARGARGFGAEITVAGTRPQMNNYRLDGISTNDYANGPPGSMLGGSLGVDAIQEFSVLTSNYSAEYGRTSGGVLNAITRSGTNQFHGAAYEFLRNSALDARNFFDGKIPPFRRNQFGADAGGPIRKDKLFVFGDYEAIRQSLGISHRDTVPSAAARGGALCSVPDAGPCTGPTPIPGGVDTSVQKYLPFWPLPNGGIKPGTNGDIGIFTFAGQQVINENFFTTRGDIKISDKDTLVATYAKDTNFFTEPDSLDAVTVNPSTNRQVATLEENHIFSTTVVNSVRIGYNRVYAQQSKAGSAINPLSKDPSLAAVPGPAEFAASVVVPGLTAFTGGVGAFSNGQYWWNSFQEYDDAFWTHGTHSLRFGGAVERMDLNRFGTGDSTGHFSFGSLAGFLKNQPQRFNAGFRNTTKSFDTRQTLFGLYTQDDWRARPSLTINMGLRWEMTTVPVEVQGKIANLINITDPLPHCGTLVASCVGIAPFFSNSTLRNFEPRVGFAWDPFHNGKTAVRGGFGLFDILPLPYMFTQSIGAQFPFSGNVQANHLLPGSFYAGAVSELRPGSRQMTYVEQHPHRSYVMQWNLTAQREFAPNVTVLVGYVGSRGVHEPAKYDDMDLVIPTKTPQGFLFPSPIGSGTKINPNFGSLRPGLIWDGNSYYDALEVGVQKKMSRGLQLQGSFTWGKSIDTGSVTGYGDQFSNSISSLHWYDVKSLRGLSDYNIARVLVINGTWQVPSPKSFSGPAAWIATGWQLGAIYKLSDGVPFTPTFGTDGDPLGTNSGDPWDFPNRLIGPGCNSLVNLGNPTNYIKTQCFAVPTAPSAAFYAANCDPTFGTFPQCFNLRGNAGRNILIGPGTSNLDFSVFKNNYVKRISENFDVQFRAECFNILNHVNFAVPITPDNTDIFDSTGAPTGVAGLLTSTTTTAREIQFALKLIW